MRSLVLLTFFGLLCSISSQSFDNAFGDHDYVDQAFEEEYIVENDSEQNRKLLRGAHTGNMTMVYEAIMNGAHTNTHLTEEMGISMGLGTPWVDFFPVPAIHIAIGGGSEGHYQAASILLDAGADPNAYAEKCPPAILFGLGYFNPPSDGLAATLMGIFSNPAQLEKFELRQSIIDWNKMKGFSHYPPLLHYAIEKHFVQGLIALVTKANVDVNEPDKNGISPLHLAAYLGQADTVSGLIQYQADVLAQDENGRLPLHYAAMRGHEGVVNAFLGSNTIIPAKKIKKMVMKRDSLGLSALDLASLFPPHTNTGNVIRNKMLDLGVLAEEVEDEDVEEISYRKAPIKGRKVSSSSSSLSDTDDSPSHIQDTDATATSTWRCPTESSSSYEFVDQIDVVEYQDISAEKLTREYLSGQRPILLTGNLTGGWKQGIGAWSIWKHVSKGDFGERYGMLKLSTVLAFLRYYTIPPSHPWSSNNFPAYVSDF